MRATIGPSRLALHGASCATTELVRRRTGAGEGITMSTSDLETSGQSAGREARTTPGSLLGARLRQARYSRDLTQGELADGQFSVSYISGVERGQIRPSLGALERLAARLEVPIAELMRLEDGEAERGRAPRAQSIPAGAREDV